MRALLRRGVEKLDSVHLLTRYDLFREEGTDGRVVQRPHESPQVFASRQQRQLRQFQASYSKRTVYRDLSNGGTPELFLLSHALEGAVVFLVYNGARRQDSPHVIASIHTLSEADREAVLSGHDIYAGTGEQWPPARYRFPANTVQICLLHDSYRGVSQEPNHWDLFHFYADNHADALPSWTDYERESDAHEQRRRNKMAQLADRIRTAHEEAYRLRAFAAQRNLAAESTRAAKHIYQGNLPRQHPFPCGETDPSLNKIAPSTVSTAAAASTASSTASSAAAAAAAGVSPVPSPSDALECDLELRASGIAPDRLGVFAVRLLPAGLQLPYPSIIMAERVHVQWQVESGVPTGAVRINLPFTEWSPTAQQQYAAVGMPSRKAAVIHGVSLAAERVGTHVSPNCSLFHLHREQVTSVVTASRALGLKRPVLHDGLVYVQVMREVSAGDELVLRVMDAQHPPEFFAEPSSCSNTTNHAQGLSTLNAARIAPRSLAPVSYLPSIDCVPVEIVELGIQRWQMARRSAAESGNPLHRDALDDALAGFQWELEAHSSDGARTEIIQYQQARRQQSRDVAAAHSSHMEGERRCELLKVLLSTITDPTKRTQGV